MRSGWIHNRCQCALAAESAAVWVRDTDDIVIYDGAASPRLVSVPSNPTVVFEPRRDIRVRCEGVAIAGSSPVGCLSGCIGKCGAEIERLRLFS